MILCKICLDFWILCNKQKKNSAIVNFRHLRGLCFVSCFSGEILCLLMFLSFLLFWDSWHVFRLTYCNLQLLHEIYSNKMRKKKTERTKQINHKNNTLNQQSTIDTTIAVGTTLCACKPYIWLMFWFFLLIWLFFSVL